MFYFDPLYIIFALPALVIGLIASFLVKSRFNKYLNVFNGKNLNGIETANIIAQRRNLAIKFEEGTSDLQNHYNPLNSTIRLSQKVARTPSIASVAITAHELGHATQHKEGSLSLKVRSILTPIVGFSTNIGYFLLIFGIILNITGLAFLGIILFSTATVFTIITLPIEFEASNKAMEMIKEYQLLDSVEQKGARKVLTAAALTYVAATIQSIGTLLYFFLRVRGVKRG